MDSVNRYTQRGSYPWNTATRARNSLNNITRSNRYRAIIDLNYIVALRVASLVALSITDDGVRTRIIVVIVIVVIVVVMVAYYPLGSCPHINVLPSYSGLLSAASRRNYS